MNFPNWLSPEIPIKRWPYLLTGLLLFALKYNFDRMISYAVFNRTWYFTDYFDFSQIESMTKRSDYNFPLTFIIPALPFIFVGTILTLRRLLDAGLPRWMVGLFFLPYMNLLFFAFLSFMPSVTGPNADETHRRAWLDQIIPQSKNKTAFLAAIVTALLATFA